MASKKAKRDYAAEYLALRRARNCMWFGHLPQPMGCEPYNEGMRLLFACPACGATGTLEVPIMPSFDINESPQRGLRARGATSLLKWEGGLGPMRDTE